MNDQPHDVATRAVADEIATDTFVVNTEGEALVSGRGAFIADIELPGMQEVAFLRSPIARARIADIDVSEAKAAPGVSCVVTGRDIWADCPQLLPRAAMVLHPSEFAPETYTLPAYPLLPIDALHFEGEAVAMAVAETRYQAEDAVDLISLDYEEQTPILDPEQSLAQGCEGPLAALESCGLSGSYCDGPLQFLRVPDAEARTDQPQPSPRDRMFQPHGLGQARVESVLRTLSAPAE